jgi:predicted metalloprotease with PDZ domain
MKRLSIIVALAAFFLLAPAVRAADPARPIELIVDASQAPRKLVQARMIIPAAPGPLTLYYPKWIPGEHAPTGPINDLSGLKLRAGGKPLSWRRDDEDLYAFHCTVPEGADSVEVSLEYLGSSSKDGFTAGASMTERLAILSWHWVLVYPGGKPVRDQQVHASLTVPAGWKMGTALPIEAQKASSTQFKTVSLETLVDSPVLCGAHLKEVPLGEFDGRPHFLVLACDNAAGLDISAEVKTQYERLVAEAGALFGGRHYRSYRFLVTLSDQLRWDGIEHHECSDNRLPERFFVDSTYRKQWGAWLLPHEYVHSWNGKYRRPDGLDTPDFQKPHRTRLLWVYEGLTQYLGLVLAARSGLWTPELSRENFALIADWARNQTGRTWRPLDDTTTAAPFLYSARTDWASRRRSVDFYDEGALLWLDVDTLIRQKTSGKKSLDDFCRAFYGKEGGPEVKSYTFEDIVSALNDVVAHDWKGLLEKRLRGTDAEPPLDGLTRGGWKVVFKNEAGDVLRTRDTDEKSINLTTALGLLLKEDGTVTDVVPGKPADKAGIGPNMKIVAVNNRRFNPDRLRQAVEATKEGGEKLVLLMENNEFFRSFPLDYSGGEKYPHLERATGDDLLSAVLEPRTRKAPR